MKNKIDRADTVIILDFETTGLSPQAGDRAIEIGAVRIEQGRVTDRFQSLMNPGKRVPVFIESYTGITNALLKMAPASKVVMTEFADFIEDFNLVAHNAAFDRRFLSAELQHFQRHYHGDFACSMLVARRLYPEAPNHKLGTLVAWHQLSDNTNFHRALADAEMTTLLWLKMLTDLRVNYNFAEIPFTLMQAIARTGRSRLPSFLQGKARHFAAH